MLAPQHESCKKSVQFTKDATYVVLYGLVPVEINPCNHRDIVGTRAELLYMISWLIYLGPHIYRAFRELTSARYLV